MTTVPVSPDGKYHYFIGFTMREAGSGHSVGGAAVVVDRPLLYGDGSIDSIRDGIAADQTAMTLVITSIGLLAAPNAKETL